VSDDAAMVSQCRDLATALFRLPPPARAQIAHDLYEQGVRIHPEHATKKVVREGPENLSGWAPAHLERADAMDILRSVDPALAARIDTARTDAQKLELREEIRAKFPTQIADIEARIAAAEQEGTL
jgi:hypothetical protein